MTKSERYIIRTATNMFGMTPHRKVRGFRKPLVTFDRDEAHTYANRETAEKWVHLFRGGEVVPA